MSFTTEVFSFLPFPLRLYRHEITLPFAIAAASTDFIFYEMQETSSRWQYGIEDRKTSL